MYSVNQHWDPLKVCIVGKSYEPEFYSFIKDSKVRSVFEKIAEETEEDYQLLVKTLESLDVEVLRPKVYNDYRMYLRDGKILPPPMVPRDYTMMLGNKFYFKNKFTNDWYPYDRFDYTSYDPVDNLTWGHIIDHINRNGADVINDVAVVNPPKDYRLLNHFNSANATRIGKDLYFGTQEGNWWINGKGVPDFSTSFGEFALEDLRRQYQEQFPDYRCHVINSLGHTDGVFSAVVPGLIVSLFGVETYQETFPGWEVVHLKGESWDKVKPFLELKLKNRGKWWVPGEELNNEFTDYVEQWMGHWVGYVEETVFDVNMLTVDEQNVICNNYNKEVFDAFEKRGITAHIVNFRHRYFWDGGLHCVTSDINRIGMIKDFFPDRGNPK